MEFNLENSLKERGFEIVEKSREMLAVKGMCSIYYATDDVVEDGNLVGMKILVGNEIVFSGRMPQATNELDKIMNMQ